MRNCDISNIKNIEESFRSDKFKKLISDNGMLSNVYTDWITDDYAVTHLVIENTQEGDMSDFMIDLRNSIKDNVNVEVSYNYVSPTAKSLTISYNKSVLSRLQGEQVKKRDETSESIKTDNSVGYKFKGSETILSNLDKINNWENNKTISPDLLWNKVQQLGVPKDQLELIKSQDGNNVEEKLVNFLANYSYNIEIKTATEKNTYNNPETPETDSFEPIDGVFYNRNWTHEGFEYEGWNRNLMEFFPVSETEWNQKFKEYKGDKSPTQHYSNLTVPGGTNYIEQEIATPDIIPSIKGHAQFSTDFGVGWVRSDEQRSDKLNSKELQESLDYIKEEFESGRDDEDTYNEKLKRVNALETDEAIGSRTRRILEVQSDIFQKGRDDFNLVQKYSKSNEDQDRKIEDYYKWMDKNGITDYTITDDDRKRYKEETQQSTSNQFLQLLNKNNNWVTFFLKSVVQNSAKQGYEKILFPSGNTASRVEGHTTLEEYKKTKQDRLKELEIKKENLVVKESKPNSSERTHFTAGDYKSDSKEEAENFIELRKRELDNEITQLEKELADIEGPQGFGALKPIYNFYENTIQNILNKQYGKESITRITDEYGNDWFELNINDDFGDDVSLSIKTESDNLTEEQNKNIYDLKSIVPEYNQFSNEEINYAIDQLIPNSKVKKIVWHGDVNPSLRNFKKIENYQDDYYKRQGFFAGDGLTETSRNNLKKHYGNNLYPVLLDIRNSQPNLSGGDNGFQSANISKEFDSGVITQTDFSEEFGGINSKTKTNLYVAFEPSQITILNSLETISKITDIINERNTNNTQNNIQNNTNSKIQELINSGEIVIVDEEGRPCAAIGISTGMTPGGSWKVLKDFSGPSHAKGGIDIQLGNGKMRMSNQKGEFKAEFGMLLPNEGNVIGDPGDPLGPVVVNKPKPIDYTGSFQDIINSTDERLYNTISDNIVKRYKGKKETLDEYLNTVAYHESKGDTQAKQMGGGPGRGLYQFEANSLKTAGVRTKKYLEKNNMPIPDYIEGTANGEITDATKLTEYQNKILLLGDYTYKPNMSLGKLMSGKWSYEDAWVNGHWAGSDPNKPEIEQKRRESFNRDQAQYKANKKKTKK